eukprot:TRINITY_DN4461_c0_g1_i4.p1 TRINITY_DN4461_c0_g1~~TRINITY_DN4461_c0_g1_i4.p1  ORF type:complete len:737 (-),score=47.66 TRINITY_DN4461_c0_g1_i4:23-2233(-)
MSAIQLSLIRSLEQIKNGLDIFRNLQFLSENRVYLVNIPSEYFIPLPHLLVHENSNGQDAKILVFRVLNQWLHSLKIDKLTKQEANIVEHTYQLVHLGQSEWQFDNHLLCYIVQFLGQCSRLIPRLPAANHDESEDQKNSIRENMKVVEIASDIMDSKLNCGQPLLVEFYEGVAALLASSSVQDWQTSYWIFAQTLQLHLQAHNLQLSETWNFVYLSVLTKNFAISLLSHPNLLPRVEELQSTLLELWQSFQTPHQKSAVLLCLFGLLEAHQARKIQCPQLFQNIRNLTLQGIQMLTDFDVEQQSRYVGALLVVETSLNLQEEFFSFLPLKLDVILKANFQSIFPRSNEQHEQNSWQQNGWQVLYGNKIQNQFMQQFRQICQSQSQKDLIFNTLQKLRDCCVLVQKNASTINQQIQHNKQTVAALQQTPQEVWLKYLDFVMQILSCRINQLLPQEAVVILECLSCVQFLKRGSGAQPIYQTILTKSLEKVYQDQLSCVQLVSTLEPFERLICEDGVDWTEDAVIAAKMTFLFKVIQGGIPKCCKSNEDILMHGLLPQLYLYLQYPSLPTNSVVLQLFRILFQMVSEKLAVQMIPYFIKRSLQVCSQAWFDWVELNRSIIVATSRCWNDIGMALLIMDQFSDFSQSSKSDIDLLVKIGSCLCGVLLVVPVELIGDWFQYYEQFLQLDSSIQVQMVDKLFDVLSQCHDQSRKFECARRYNALQQQFGEKVQHIQNTQQ